MLKVIFQMDHLHQLNFSGDSTYMLMQEAFLRGHKVYFYHPKTLGWSVDTVFADVYEVTNILDYTITKPNEIPIISKNSKITNLERFDVLFIRQDPPFNMAYITYTFILEKLINKILMINNPISIRNSPEKLLVTEFSNLMPKTLITSSKKDILDFLNANNRCVIKPLYGNGGADVFFLQLGDPNINSIIDYFLSNFKEPVMVQEFVSNVVKGDKRIILVDGEPHGVVNRIPPANEIRANMAAGGTTVATKLEPADIKICEEIGPTLKRLELFFVGIDVIDGYLTEINVTSPTGLRAIKNLNNPTITNLVWEKIENKVNK